MKVRKVFVVLGTVMAFILTSMLLIGCEKNITEEQAIYKAKTFVREHYEDFTPTGAEIIKDEGTDWIVSVHCINEQYEEVADREVEVSKDGINTNFANVEDEVRWYLNHPV